MKLVIDFETRATADLAKCGADVYAAHPDTEAMCCAVKVDDQAPVMWLPPWILQRLADENVNPVDHFPLIDDATLFGLLARAEEIEAHNASFETFMWQNCCIPKYGWPPVPHEKIRCSMAKAAYHNLPQNLEKLAAALDLPKQYQKDMAGSALMKKMCKPRKPLKADRIEYLADGTLMDMETYFYHPESESRVYLWAEDTASIIRLCEYCLQDTVAEYHVSKALPGLPPSELAIWQFDQMVNRRGVLVDTKAAKLFMDEVEDSSTGSMDDILELTGGMVTKIKAPAQCLAFVKSRGVDMPNFTQDAVSETLKRTDIPDDVRKFLKLRQRYGKSSTSKYAPLLLGAGSDGRFRGAFVYHGAGTGRWSSRRAQLHNFPRGSFGDSAHCIQVALDNGFNDYFAVMFGDVVNAASTCLRGMFMAPPGKKLYVGDFSSVEARFNAWLAGEETDLEAFRTGKDLYKVAASGIFNVEYSAVTKQQRQVGKTAVLALGYGGGINAFATMATNYGIDLEELPAFVLPGASEEVVERARKMARAFVKKNPGVMSEDAATACDVVKQLWRQNHPHIVNLWACLEEAAMQAVKNPGKVYVYRSIKYLSDGRFLRCKLPSGRYLHYYKPEARMMTPAYADPIGVEESVRKKYAHLPGPELAKVVAKKLDELKKEVVTFWGTSSKPGSSGKFIQQALYGGLLCENCCQSGCRDLLAHSMLNLEAAGYNIVMHVHDEAVAETAEDFGSLKEFESIMAQAPAWAEGMPMGVEGFETARYRK